MALLAFSLSFALAATLLSSAARKIVARGDVVEMMSGLRVPRRLRSFSSWFLIVLEYALGCALLLTGRATAVAVAVLALFGIFAAIGVYALASQKPILCSCFGSASSQHLGSRQLVQLPIVAAALAVILRSAPEWSLTTRLAILILGQAASAGLLLAMSLRGWRLVRDQRISLRSGEAFQAMRAGREAVR